MKKGLTAVLLLITLLCAMPVISSALAAPSEAADEYVRVGLEFDSSIQSAEVSSAEGLILCRAEEESLEPLSDELDGCGDLYLVLTGEGVEVRTATGRVVTTLEGDGTECVISAGYFRKHSYICYEGTAYRGGIIPYINESGQMNIINFVGLEDYVKGVLDREMNHSSGLEALKAQAVTARSYAVVNEGLHASQGFDVCTGEHCQCYAGVAGEYASIVNAVDATAGEVLYYDGEAVPGYYCANSGGYTENSEDVWAEKRGYLRSVEDEYSPDLSWKVTLKASELTELLASEGIGTVRSVSVDTRNDSGSVASITFNGDRGTYTAEKDAIRSLLGLKSNQFTIGSGGILFGEKNVKTVSLENPSDRLVIRGAGFGHGIGMSQQGAQEMARQGYDYRDILEYYYTDIEVR